MMPMLGMDGWEDNIDLDIHQVIKNRIVKVKRLTHPSTMVPIYWISELLKINALPLSEHFSF